MPAISFRVVWFLFSLVWMAFLASCLVVRVSKRNGRYDPSCRVYDAKMACKTLEYAIGALEERRNINETIFTFAIEDVVYALERRVKILQTSQQRSVNLTSDNLSSRTVIRCEGNTAGIDIGKQGNYGIKTRNIHFQDLEFQNCGPSFAAVVLIWNSVDITFTNCVFRHNRQAGINAFDSGVTIESCSFVNNTSNAPNSTEEYKEGVDSAGGGAGFLYHTEGSLSLFIRNSLFESNTAVTNDSQDFIAPSSNISHFTTGGGGVIVVLRSEAKDCRVVIDSSVFLNNSATYGGGLYFAVSNMAIRNNFTVTNSNFTANYAGQTGGGLIFSQWDNVSSITSIFQNCIVSENRSQRGAGMNVFFMNHDLRENDSKLRFQSVIFSNNHGKASTAVRITTALPYGSTIDVTPEFINCTFKDHNMSNIAHTNPFTSQRVNLRFQGRNIFQQNYGGGAAGFQDCVIFVQGKLTFANNSGSNGGALFVRSSQIKLYPGSELLFLGNKASGLGGAIFVREHPMDEFIHVNNPDCFLAYSDPGLPPSKWKTNVSFIENRSTFKGAAIYISSLQRCVWKEEPPFRDSHKALRWSSNFLYQNNSLIWDGGMMALTGSKYDIATDTKSYRSSIGDNLTVKLAPGEELPLDLQALDELGHEVTAIILVSELDQNNETSRVLFDHVLYVLSPNNTVPFSFMEDETLYNETVEHNIEGKRKIQFIAPYSTLINGYSFDLELQTCRPGFVFSKELQKCMCNKELNAVQRCENGRTVYIKEGYWAGAVNNSLVTYYCPFKYCNCTRKSGLPGCLFDPENSDDQCGKNREGWMCGKCKRNTSVGLRWSECINCEKSGWILGVIIPIVIGLCVLVIWINPGISSELRGPLFFFQVLPFIFDPTSHLGGHVFLAADIFNFGGPFIFLFTTCIVEGMDNLYSITFGYMLPFLALFVFLLAYCLSTNYYLTFNLRNRSMLRSFWLLLLFVYNYLVKTSFLILFCPKVGGKHVFFYDGTIECFHGNHLPIGIIAIFVLVLLVIPPPIVIVLLTNGIWRVGPQYVGTLTASFRPECRWWWSVDLARRVLVVATYSFVPNWQTKKILMIFVSVLILTVHSNSQPYLRPRANLAESVYLLVLCILALMQVVEDDNARYPVCLVLLVILTVHALVVFFYKAGRFFRERFGCCTCALATFIKKRSYEELENTRTNQTLDMDAERQRSILDAIFSTSEEIDSDHS